ncbi:chymotrypsin-2-like [Ischnura elegans]|uniref:chymotrypsin-2-like n=1 Tax=Ischnura elegans TaxID=197161 RepID=UPI001ED87BE8|nr:chymotrypsin-2-like [Ischnura elegans]
MNIFTVAAILIVCAHAQAFDVRRLHPVGGPLDNASVVKKNTLQGTVEREHDVSKPKIAGGKTAELGDIPFQVSIDIDMADFCGGTIIDRFYVLTTANCAMKGSQYVIYAGVVKLRGDESSRVVIQSSHAIIYEGFNPGSFYGDLALIQLPNFLEFNQFIKPAYIPINDDTYAGEIAWISGWGASSSGGSLASELQYTQVPIMSNEHCRVHVGAYITDYIYTTTDYICTTYLQGHGECFGDYGGPLFVGKLGGSATLIGVYTDSTPAHCGQRTDVYTRVSSFRGWIDGHIR